MTTGAEWRTLYDAARISKVGSCANPVVARHWEPEGVDIGGGLTAHCGFFSRDPKRNAKGGAKRFIMVAVDDGRAVAWGGFRLIFVKPEYRGRGLGSVLYALALRRWPEEGRAHITGDSIQVTRGGERALYRAFELLDQEPPPFWSAAP